MSDPDASLSDLERELLVASSEMTMAGMRQLFAMGADRRFSAALVGAGMLGAASISVTREGWEPVGPDRRLLVGVGLAGQLVDIVALSSVQRDEWALRTGLGWALGAENIDRAHARMAAHMGERPLRLRLKLHPTPFDWLAAAGEGICVLDWCSASLMELRSLGERVTLEVPAGGADRIRGLLAFGGLPRVSERGGAMGMAA